MRNRKDKPPKIKVTINPRNVQRTISVPKIKYKVVEDPVLETAFTGDVTVIPTILLFYLTPGELKVISVIIQDTMKKARCELTVDEIAQRAGITSCTVRIILKRLLKMEVISDTRDGWKHNRALMFNNIQKLDRLLADENKAIYTRLRKVCKTKKITSITKKDTARCYDNIILPLDDIEENEEYN